MRKTTAKVLGALVILTLLIVLTACGPQSGTVYAKDFYPEHTESRTVQDYIWVSRYNPATKQTEMKQMWVGSHEEYYQVPDCWWIGFEDEDGDKGEDCVGKTRWETIEVGDYYEKD